MKKSFTAALAATACILGSSVASATVISFTDQDGSYSGGLTAAVSGTGLETYTFTAPVTGYVVVDAVSVAEAKLNLVGATFGTDTDDRYIQGKGVVVELSGPDGNGDPVVAGQTYSFTIAYSGTGTIGGDIEISPGAIPEPTTWAMMLLGLGMIGFAARRRHNVSVKYA